MNQIKILEEAKDESSDNQEAINYKNAILEAQLNSTTDGMIIVDEAGKRILQNKRVSEIWKIPDHVQS